MFPMQYFACLVSFWCMLWIGVEVWVKKILYWFIEGWTHFSMPRGAKMSLALDELIYDVLRLNLHTDSKHAPKKNCIWKSTPCKTMNSWPKLRLNRRKTLILCNFKLYYENVWRLYINGVRTNRSSPLDYAQCSAFIPRNVDPEYGGLNPWI